MARKIRELIADLMRSEFIDRGGKGIHRDFTHSKGVRITGFGKEDDDATPYLEKAARQAIEEAKKNEPFRQIYQDR